VSDQFLLF